MGDLPPLNALRAFEAAARFESFNLAAEQLNVTPSAISHQIKSLEAILGVTLFHRRTRAVRLTDAGRDFLPSVHGAFEQLRTAVARINPPRQARVLTVSAAPIFAMGWLIPRLADFRTAHPDIDVRLDTALELVDFATSDVDVAIRYTAKPKREGLVVHWLFRGDPVVVCAPGVAAELENPEDLHRVPLLHSSTSLGNWRAWLASADITGINSEQGPRFDNDTLALEAAMNGLGVAIAHRETAARWIEKGHLVAPFNISVPGHHGYHLVYPEAAGDHHKVAAFREWLLRILAEEDVAPQAQDGAGTSKAE